jgi:putative SOS response-associated peptidase YedK
MHQRLAPTMSAPVVRRHPESEERHLDLLTWGLVPSFTKDFKAARKPINAHAETVASSGMFKNALAKRRCLVPGAIARADGDPLAFAGIWDGWRSPGGDVLRSFAIITTEANAQMSALHSRMSVILEQADWPLLLGEADSGAEMLLRPAPKAILRIWPVDKRVGNVRNDGPDLLEPGERHRPDHHQAGDGAGGTAFRAASSTVRQEVQAGQRLQPGADVRPRQVGQFLRRGQHDRPDAAR